MVGALCDPTIVFKCGWADTLPEWVKGEIQLQRLIQLMAAQKDESQRGIATDVEAMAYMYPRTLEAPLDHDWVEIYMYLCTRVMKNNLSNRNCGVPKDIQKDSLTNYQMGLLTHLKRWVYQQRVKARKAKARGERLEAKEEAKARVMKPEDLMEPMFKF